MKLPFKPSFWLSSFFFTFLQRFSLFGFSVFSIIILTHTWSNAEIATYALFQAVISMIEVVKMGLLRNALIKFIHDERFANKRREVESAALLINVLFSVLVILFLFFAGGWLATLLKTPALERLLNWGILMVIIQIPFNHCEMIQQSKMLYKTTFYAYFIRQGLLFSFIATAALTFSGFITIEHLIVTQIITMGVGAIYFLIASRKLIVTSFTYDHEVVTRLLHFGKFVFGTSLLSSLSKTADHFVTAYAIGNPALGKLFVSYYNVVARITSLLDFPFIAVADVLFPKSAEAMANEGTEKVKFYFEKMVGILTALIIPVSLVIFIVPELVIKIVAGSGYKDAVPILRFTMFFSFLRPFVSHFGFTMDSIGKPQLNFLINLLILIISMGSTYWFIIWFGGYMGAIYATTFTIVSVSVFTYLILRNSLQISLSNILNYMLGTYIDLYGLVRTVVSRRTKPA